MRLLNCVVFLVTICLFACSSNPPAPVIDRLPSQSTSSSKPTNSLSSRSTFKQGDWRPDSYVIKKGDTLFSIGLEFGYDYKDIAVANNLAAPYLIKTGQVLKFTSLNETSKTGNCCQ